jgi:hypothetical protein
MKKFISNDVMRQAFCGFLAVTALLFAACSDLLPLPGNTKTGAGTGRVQVNVLTSAASTHVQSARTVYPPIPHQDSLHYVYVFTRDEENAEEQVKTPDTVGGSVFTLETGNWNLTVKAYLEAGHEKLVATGSTGSAFTIADGELNSTITVTLAPEKSEGEGTLTYTITYPAGAAFTSLTWEPAAGTVAGANYSLPAYTTNGVKVIKPEAVDAGYYVFTALLTHGDKTAGKSEVVHIYQNLTTDVDLVFIPSDFTCDLSYENTPNASINYVDETLLSLVPGDYSFAYDPYTVSGTTYPIDEDWIGTNLSIIKKGSSPAKLDSPQQLLTIKARPAAPTTVVGGAGRITGTNGTMEYTAGVNWIPITGTSVTGLAAGSYAVRIKAVAGTSFKSAEVPLTVTPTVGTGSVVISLWTDDNTAKATSDKATLKQGETAVLNAAGTYESRRWVVNGVDTGETGTSYTFESATRGVGQYTITLTARVGDEWYSTNVVITVTSETESPKVSR